MRYEASENAHSRQFDGQPIPDLRPQFPATQGFVKRPMRIVFEIIVLPDQIKMVHIMPDIGRNLVELIATQIAMDSRRRTIMRHGR